LSSSINNYHSTILHAGLSKPQPSNIPAKSRCLEVVLQFV
jgi:hypothetical protein